MCSHKIAINLSQNVFFYIVFDCYLTMATDDVDNIIFMRIIFTTALADLHAIISKMPLYECCETVLPEFGVNWHELAKVVHQYRLPMVSASVARVLCKAVAPSLDVEEVEGILMRLRVQLISTQTRKWHLIELTDPISDEPVRMRGLRGRVIQALRNGKNRGMTPQVATLNLGNLIYMSVQLVSSARQGTLLYVAVPPGEDVALVTSLSSLGLLRATVQGLGYNSYINAKLHGQDINSLLRIHNRNCNGNAEHLISIPEYAPVPVITNNGIDFTNKDYNQQYVDSVIGPDPPLLTELNIKSTQPFFDASRLNKMINLNVQLKSDDISRSLKAWVANGALAPTSEFFNIFHQAKSNDFVDE